MPVKLITAENNFAYSHLKLLHLPDPSSQRSSRQPSPISLVSTPNYDNMEGQFLVDETLSMF